MKAKSETKTKSTKTKNTKTTKSKPKAKTKKTSKKQVESEAVVDVNLESDNETSSTSSDEEASVSAEEVKDTNDVQVLEEVAADSDDDTDDTELEPLQELPEDEYKDVEEFKDKSLFDALRLLADKYTHLRYNMRFEASYGSELKVYDMIYNRKQKVLILISGSPESFDGLFPDVYTDDDMFLNEFLSVFQHIMNTRDLLLDDIDKFFSPKKAPKFFLPLLAAWFNIDLSLLGNDEYKARKMIQFAVPIYRLRGTKKGLQALLYLVSNIVPEIIEGAAPFTEMAISSNVQIDSPIFGNSLEKFSFYVYFPVLETELDETLVENIHKIVQKEKPAYMKAYVCFKRPKSAERIITTFTNESEVMGEDGVFF